MKESNDTRQLMIALRPEVNAALAMKGYST